jgi:deazaflavin-dependent oxidoreductase (nitroreductase family)
MWQTVKRWMYRGNRPNWIAQLLNKGWAALHSSGIVPNWVTLEVMGRKSGRIVSLPVVVVLVDGRRYLVSMLGSEAQWVLNVRAASGKAYIRSGRRTEVRLEEVPAAERAPILKAYLQRAPGARPHIPVNKAAPLSEFQAVAASFPAFRIVPNITE